MKFLVVTPPSIYHNMTKNGLLYHYMRHLLKNNNAHIMVNDPRPHIPKVGGNKKEYTDRDVKKADCPRWFQHITSQLIKRILHTVDNNIMQKYPML